MALAKLPKNKTEKDENIPVLETAVVVDRDIQISKMLKYINGKNWPVTYYNSVKRKNELIERADRDKRTIENQFTKIEKLTLKVTSGLETESLSELTGSAIIPVNIIPVVGDAFTARIISGEIGLFIVTSVKEKSYKLDRTFEIEYRLDTTNVINSKLLYEIEQRVIRTFVYEDNVTLDDRNPLLMKDVDDFYRNMKKTMHEISVSYYNMFIKNYGYLTLTRNKVDIYDPFIMMLYSELSDLPPTYVYAKQHLEIDRQYPFSGLISDGFPLTFHKAGLISNMPIKGYQRGRLRDHLPTTITKIVSINEYTETMGITVESEYLPKMDYGDDSYLIREDGKTLMEICIKGASAGKELSYTDIETMVSDRLNWNDEEFYWYGPLLLYLIKHTIANIRSIY